MISKNFGNTWENAKIQNNLIVVIVPGAGSFLNKKAYEHLSLKYKLYYIDAENRNDGFDYLVGLPTASSVSLLPNIQQDVQSEPEATHHTSRCTKVD